MNKGFCGLDRVLRMMKSKKQYDLVSDDSFDSRIPLHNEDAFKHGISFQAKYIGTLDVPRPSSRVEIVAAMRRIRFEFKAKAIKKKKINLIVSVDGVKVTLRKKTKRSVQWTWDDSRLMVLSHPIYRIFYVSHDSQDLKIFSYIARNGANNVFKCNVFKAYKKSQAMRIVRTVGQAFEVCHKISIQGAALMDENNDAMAADDEKSSDDNDTVPHSRSMPERVGLVTSRLDASVDTLESANHVHSTDHVFREEHKPTMTAMTSKTTMKVPGPTPSFSSPLLRDSITPTTDRPLSLTTPATPATPTTQQLPISSSHQLQLLRQHVEQQQQQTQSAMEQVQLLKDQLSAETSARIESQSRNQQLMSQNRDLLDHINVLVTRLHDLEMRVVTQTPDMPLEPPAMTELTTMYKPTAEPTQGVFVSGEVKTEDSADSTLPTDMSIESLSHAAHDPWYRSTAQMLRSDPSTDSRTNESSVGGASRQGFNLPLNNNTTTDHFRSPNIPDQNANVSLATREGRNVGGTLSTPAQEGNKLDVVAPRINPPPKIYRTSSRSRSSFSDITSPDSNSSGGSNRSSLASSTSGDMRSMTGSTNGSAFATNLRKNVAEPLIEMNNLNLSDDQQKLDLFVNNGNISHVTEDRGRIYCVGTKRQSLSDEENGGATSEDSGLPGNSTQPESVPLCQFSTMSPN